jgi:transcriptional regulator with XRE-family HTH domain
VHRENISILNKDEMNMRSCQRQIPACGEARPDGRRPGGQVTQKEIAEIVGIHPATVSKILNRESDYTSVNIKQKVFDLALKLGYDFKQLKSVQTRKNTRKPVDLPVRVIIVMVNDNDRNKVPSNDEPRTRAVRGEVVWDTGQARVCDISQDGALLSDIQLSKNALPLQPFRLKLVLEPPPDGRAGAFGGAGIVMPNPESIRGLAENTLSCQVVRLSHTGSREGETHDQIKVGLKFETVPEETRNRLAELCSNCLTASVNS